MKELREQLRRREVLEFEVEHLKNMVSDLVMVQNNSCMFLKGGKIFVYYFLKNGEKDKQIESLHKENVLLRQQKESLMNVLR